MIKTQKSIQKVVETINSIENECRCYPYTTEKNINFEKFHSMIMAMSITLSKLDIKEE